MDLDYYSRSSAIKQLLFTAMVLRWIPDVVTEEFYNVGVVVYEPTTHYLKGLFH
jgi:hypothetical protein